MSINIRLFVLSLALCWVELGGIWLIDASNLSSQQNPTKPSKLRRQLERQKISKSEIKPSESGNASLDAISSRGKRFEKDSLVDNHLPMSSLSVASSFQYDLSPERHSEQNQKIINQQKEKAIKDLKRKDVRDVKAIRSNQPLSSNSQFQKPLDTQGFTGVYQINGNEQRILITETTPSKNPVVKVSSLSQSTISNPGLLIECLTTKAESIQMDLDPVWNIVKNSFENFDSIAFKRNIFKSFRGLFLDYVLATPEKNIHPMNLSSTSRTHPSVEIFCFGSFFTGASQRESSDLDLTAIAAESAMNRRDFFERFKQVIETQKSGVEKYLKDVLEIPNLTSVSLNYLLLPFARCPIIKITLDLFTAPSSALFIISLEPIKVTVDLDISFISIPKCFAQELTPLSLEHKLQDIDLQERLVKYLHQNRDKWANSDIIGWEGFLSSLNAHTLIHNPSSLPNTKAHVSPATFLTALLYLKLWAKSHRLYGTQQGRFNGVVLTMLTLKIAPLSKSDSPVDLVRLFFEFYSKYDFVNDDGQPMVINENFKFNLPGNPSNSNFERCYGPKMTLVPKGHPVVAINRMSRSFALLLKHYFMEAHLKFLDAGGDKEKLKMTISRSLQVSEAEQDFTRFTNMTPKGNLEVTGNPAEFLTIEGTLSFPTASHWGKKSEIFRDLAIYLDSQMYKLVCMLEGTYDEYREFRSNVAIVLYHHQIGKEEEYNDKFIIKVLFKPNSYLYSTGFLVNNAIRTLRETCSRVANFKLLPLHCRIDNVFAIKPKDYPQPNINVQSERDLRYDVPSNGYMAGSSGQNLSSINSSNSPLQQQTSHIPTNKSTLMCPGSLITSLLATESIQLDPIWNIVKDSFENLDSITLKRNVFHSFKEFLLKYVFAAIDQYGRPVKLSPNQEHSYLQNIFCYGSFFTGQSQRQDLDLDLMVVGRGEITREAFLADFESKVMNNRSLADGELGKFLHAAFPNLISFSLNYLLMSLAQFPTIKVTLDLILVDPISSNSKKSTFMLDIGFISIPYKFVSSFSLELGLQNLDLQRKLIDHFHQNEYEWNNPDMIGWENLLRSLNAHTLIYNPSSLKNESMVSSATFLTALLYLRRWAESHHLYGAQQGSFNGINLTMLVLKVTSLPKLDSPVELVRSFFDFYSRQGNFVNDGDFQMVINENFKFDSTPIPIEFQQEPYYGPKMSLVPNGRPSMGRMPRSFALLLKSHILKAHRKLYTEKVQGIFSSLLQVSNEELDFTRFTCLTPEGHLEINGNPDESLTIERTLSFPNTTFNLEDKPKIYCELVNYLDSQIYKLVHILEGTNLWYREYRNMVTIVLYHHQKGQQGEYNDKFIIKLLFNPTSRLNNDLDVMSITDRVKGTSDCLLREAIGHLLMTCSSNNPMARDSLSKIESNLIESFTMKIAHVPRLPSI